MTTLSSLVGDGVLSVQTAFIDEGTLTNGSAGEDDRYADITLGTTLTDYTKAVVLLDAGAGATLADGYIRSGSDTKYSVSARLTSNTNLRVSVGNNNATYISGRYQVVEYQ